MFWITLLIAWLLDWLLLRVSIDWLIDWLIDCICLFIFFFNCILMDNQRSLNWRSWSFLTPVFLGGNRCFIGSLSRGSRHLRVTFRCELHVRGFVFRVFVCDLRSSIEKCAVGPHGCVLSCIHFVWTVNFLPSSLFVSQGTNGFLELRKFIKQSAEFAKELTAILQERWVMVCFFSVQVSRTVCLLVVALTYYGTALSITSTSSGKKTHTHHQFIDTRQSPWVETGVFPWRVGGGKILHAAFDCIRV